MNKTTIEKALFILHYSPPVHGASKVGDSILKSERINKAFNAQYIKIKSSIKLDEIGKFNLTKMIFLLSLLVKVSYKLCLFRPKIIYYTASPSGFAFYRDLIISIPIKIYSLLLKPKIFYHYHAKGILSFTEHSRLNKKLTNFFLRKANLIFISKIMKDEIKLLIGYDKVFYLSNGVESKITDNEFQNIIANRIIKKKVNILYLSNMMREKGFDVVLELAEKLKKNNINNIEINFAGAWKSMSEEEFFNDFVEKKGLSNFITYHGLVQGEKKKFLFSNATLFIFPSSYKKEVFPLSVLESLSFGLPILAYDIGAISEIINDKIGLITNKEYIFEDLNKIINNYQTADIYESCRNEFLDNYSIDIFEKEIIEILKSA